MLGGALVLAGSDYLAGALGLLTSILTARLLGPGDYGAVALIVAYPALTWSIFGIKSVSVTTRYIAAFRAAGRTAELLSICKIGFALDASIAFGVFLFIGVTSWWIVPLVLPDPGLAWLVVAYAASFPLFSLAGTSSAVLSGSRRFGLLAAMQLIDRVVILLLLLLFFLAGYRVSGVVIATALGHSVVGVAMLLAASLVLHQQGGGPWWRADLGAAGHLRGELGGLLGWNYLIVTFAGVLAQGPLIVLGRLRGPEEAGFYRLALTLTTVGSYLESSFARVVYPVLSERAATALQVDIKPLLIRWTSRGGIPAFAIVLATVPFLPHWIPPLFGTEFGPMAFGAQLMMASTAIGAAFFWLNSFYYAWGSVQTWAKGLGAYCGIVIGSSWWVAHTWGFEGIAALGLVAKIAFIGVMLAVAYKMMNRRRQHSS